MRGCFTEIRVTGVLLPAGDEDGGRSSHLASEDKLPVTSEGGGEGCSSRRAG